MIPATRIRRTAWLAVVSAALAVGSAPARAQLGATTGTGASYQYYRFDDPQATQARSIGLLTIPYAARVPVAGSLLVEISGAYARGVLTRSDGSEATISGFTDTQLRVGLALAGDRLTVAGVAMLPTGISTVTAEEAEVAGAVASDLLPFRISNWGSGGGGGATVSFAHAAGPYAVGAGASYLLSREFAPLEGSGLATYRPGDWLSAQLVVSRNVRRSEKASLQVVYQHQSEDQAAGQNLFRSGDRVQAVGSYAFRIGRTSSGIAYAGGQYRERGTALLELTRNAPSQTLLLLGGGLRLSRGGAILSPSADLRLLRSEDGIGQGYLGGVGATSEWPLGRVRVGPQLRLQLGEILVRDGAESAFVGADLGVILHL